jgi:predicted MFS family arabinose efflux permease
MSDTGSLRPALPILIGAAVMLTLSMGVRQCFGLIMQPLTRDIAITVADFTLAIAVQNLAWGFLQPPAGALAVRFGFRAVMVAGAVLYVLGLIVLVLAQGLTAVVIGAGVLIGTALACTASGIALAVASRAVAESLRSLALGAVTAAGSLGALFAAPIGQTLANGFGWRAGVLGFLLLALGMIPAAWFAGRVDAVPLPRAEAGDVSGVTALRLACTNLPFMVMTLAYFVCGMQLIFITTHLPTYLTICGMDPMLSAEALGAIAIFNVFGSLFFGWAGGRWSKGALLGAIYLARSAVLGWYFVLPPTPAGTLVFAAAMGFLWLGVGPLVAGMVAEMFGLRWQAMIQGIAFMSHQIGSFVGAFGGGVLFDRLGSYDLAWRLAVAMGLTAGIVQVAFALWRPPSRTAAAPA